MGTDTGIVSLDHSTPVLLGFKKAWSWRQIARDGAYRNIPWGEKPMDMLFQASLCLGGRVIRTDEHVRVLILESFLTPAGCFAQACALLNNPDGVLRWWFRGRKKLTGSEDHRCKQWRIQPVGLSVQQPGETWLWLAAYSSSQNPGAIVVFEGWIQSIVHGISGDREWILGWRSASWQDSAGLWTISVRASGSTHSCLDLKGKQSSWGKAYPPGAKGSLHFRKLLPS